MHFTIGFLVQLTALSMDFNSMPFILPVLLINSHSHCLSNFQSTSLRIQFTCSDFLFPCPSSKQFFERSSCHVSHPIYRVTRIEQPFYRFVHSIYHFCQSIKDVIYQNQAFDMKIKKTKNNYRYQSKIFAFLQWFVVLFNQKSILRYTVKLLKCRLSIDALTIHPAGTVLTFRLRDHVERLSSPIRIRIRLILELLLVPLTFPQSPSSSMISCWATVFLFVVEGTMSLFSWIQKRWRNMVEGFSIHATFRCGRAPSKIIEQWPSQGASSAKCCSMSLIKDWNVLLVTTSCWSQWCANSTSAEIAKVSTTCRPRHPLTSRRTVSPVGALPFVLRVKMSLKPRLINVNESVIWFMKNSAHYRFEWVASGLLRSVGTSASFPAISGYEQQLKVSNGGGHRHVRLKLFFQSHRALEASWKAVLHIHVHLSIELLCCHWFRHSNMSHTFSFLSFALHLLEPTRG